MPQDEVELVGWDRENGIGIEGGVGLPNMVGWCEDANAATCSEFELQTEAINTGQNDKLKCIKKLPCEACEG